MVAFLKKSSAKNFHTRKFLGVHSAFDRDVSTNQSIKVLVKLFQKLAQVEVAETSSPSAEGEIPFSAFLFAKLFHSNFCRQRKSGH